MSDSAGGGGGGGGGAPRMVGDPAVLAAVAAMRARQDATAAPASAVNPPGRITTAYDWIKWAGGSPFSALAMINERLSKPQAFNPAMEVWYRESPQIRKLLEEQEELPYEVQSAMQTRITAGKASATAKLNLFTAVLKYKEIYGGKPITVNEFPVVRVRSIRLVCEAIAVNKTDLAKYHAQAALETVMRANDASRAAQLANVQSQGIRNSFASFLIPRLAVSVDLMPQNVREAVKVILEEESRSGRDGIPLVLPGEPELTGPLEGMTTLGDVIYAVFNFEGLSAGQTAKLPGIKRAADNEFMLDGTAKSVADAFTAQFCSAAMGADRPLVGQEAMASEADAVAAEIGRSLEGADAAGGAPAEAGGAGGAPAEAGRAGRAGSKRKERGGYRKTRRNKNKNKRKTRSKNRKSKNKTRSKGRKPRSRSRSSRG